MNFLHILFIGLIFFVSSDAKSTVDEGNKEFDLAKMGNVDAQYNIALNFLNGAEGFPRDYNQARKWFEFAALQGDASAQNALGIMYLRGFDQQTDLEKSEYYYRLAAHQNHENAQLQLALILLNKQDGRKEAISWLKKASEQGSVEATEKLLELRKL